MFFSRLENTTVFLVCWGGEEDAWMGVGIHHSQAKCWWHDRCLSLGKGAAPALRDRWLIYHLTLLLPPPGTWQKSDTIPGLKAHVTVLKNRQSQRKKKHFCNIFPTTTQVWKSPALSPEGGNVTQIPNFKHLQFLKKTLNIARDVSILSTQGNMETIATLINRFKCLLHHFTLLAIFNNSQTHETLNWRVQSSWHIIGITPATSMAALRKQRAGDKRCAGLISYAFQYEVLKRFPAPIAGDNLKQNF